MKLKPNHVIIPLITILVALAGRYFTDLGMPWYNFGVLKPDLTPPGWAFPLAWTAIFVFTTIAALLVWNKGTSPQGFFSFLLNRKSASRFHWAVAVLFINAILNVLWTYLFFAKSLVLESFAEIIVLEMTILILVILSWKISRAASVLLLPYLIWVGFATYLNYQIVILNF
ncbi:MAG: TspO/MBR family protein [Candidatus Peregrinibacteria bacterium]